MGKDLTFRRVLFNLTSVNKKLCLFLFSLSTSSLFADAFWPIAPYCPCPPYILGAEYTFSEYSQWQTRKLVKNCSNKKKELLETRNLIKNFEWKSGFRAFFVYSPDLDSSLEFLYSYYRPWTGAKSLSSPPLLCFPFHDPFFTFDYRNADHVHASYRTSLQGAEINYIRHLTPRRCNYYSFSWLAGGRWIALTEKMRLEFRRLTDQSHYSIRTRDHLYGFQMGAILEGNPSIHWTWLLLAKGGICLNVVRNHAFLGDENDTVVLRDFNTHTWKDSYFFDARISLTYHFNKWLNITAGYQGLILLKVALAADQIDRSSGAHRHIHGQQDALVDGAFAGLVFEF